MERGCCNDANDQEGNDLGCSTSVEARSITDKILTKLHSRRTLGCILTDVLKSDWNDGLFHLEGHAILIPSHQRCCLPLNQSKDAYTHWKTGQTLPPPADRRIRFDSCRH